MKSRLPDRRPPAGRWVSTNWSGESIDVAAGRIPQPASRETADATARPAGRGLRAERGPAAAGRLGVRVLDREAAARVVVDEIHFGTLEVPEADGIDEQAHTVHF